MSESAELDRAFSLHVDENVVVVRWMPGIEITGPLASAAMATVDKLNGDHKRPLLVDMTGTANVTRDAPDQRHPRHLALAAERVARVLGDARGAAHVDQERSRAVAVELVDRGHRRGRERSGDLHPRHPAHHDDVPVDVQRERRGQAVPNRSSRAV